MAKLVIIGKHKKGKKFFGGNLMCGLTWNVGGEYDEFKPTSFIRTARINNLRKKRNFKNAAAYITMGEYCNRMGLRLSKLEIRKIKKYLDAGQIWINWEHHLEEIDRDTVGLKNGWR